MAEADRAGDRSGDALRDALRPALGFLANVTVVTALLVYFGWRRAETQADELGIDESILEMSTQEYLLRSVGPVLTLLVAVGGGGLVWLSIERRLTPWLQLPARPRAASLVVYLLGLAWLILPLAVIVGLGGPTPALAFIVFPASIGAGVLLWLYATNLKQPVKHPVEQSEERPDEETRRRRTFVVAFAGLLVLVCVFWTASNYAEVLGEQLANDFAGQITDLPGVMAYSENRLHLDGPGVQEVELDDEGTVRYRYDGLRLLEHTGGKYFLVSDGWTTDYGVVFVLHDSDRSMRLDFVRDHR